MKIYSINPSTYIHRYMNLRNQRGIWVVELKSWVERSCHTQGSWKRARTQESSRALFQHNLAERGREIVCTTRGSGFPLPNLLLPRTVRDDIFSATGYDNLPRNFKYVFSPTVSRLKRDCKLLELGLRGDQHGLMDGLDAVDGLTIYYTTTTGVECDLLCE